MTSSSQKVGKPDRTYVWGESLGGLITELLAEKHPDWIAGAAPLCGVLGGTNLNFDLAMDLAYGVKTLLAPGLKTDDYGSYDEAKASFEQAQKAVLAAHEQHRRPRQAAAAGRAGGRADPDRELRRLDPAVPRGALVEGILTGLAFGTTVRQELERRVGGNPSGNEDADYAARVSAAERALIETRRARLDRRQPRAAGRRQPGRAGRRRRGRSSPTLGTPTGDITVPTLTLHTEADPLVLVQNESRVRRQGRRVEGHDRRPGAALHEGAGRLRQARAVRGRTLQLHRRRADRVGGRAGRLGARRRLSRPARR